MNFSKHYLLLLFCLLFQNVFFAQFVGVAFHSSNSTVTVRLSKCSRPNGEVFKAFIENDSLFFVDNEGVMRVITVAKNKGGPALNNAPAIACDNSNGANRGRIYICWSSEKNGLKNKDVFIVYSDDKGKTWIDPVLVTYRPNHRAQVMPIITVDQTNGNLYILYYDNQNYFDNETINDVYLAVSNNGGLKYNYYKLNNEPLKILLNTQDKNYLNLNSENGIVTAGWNQTGKNKTPQTHVIINDTFFATYQKNNLSEISFDKTLSFSAEIKINITSTIDTKITAAITKPLLAGFEKPVVKNFKIKKGNNQLIIDIKKAALQKGNYVLTLYYTGKNDFIWITEE